MELNAAIKNMTTRIADILSLNGPSVYIYGSYVLDDFQYGWSDIDIIVLTVSLFPNNRLTNSFVFGRVSLPKSLATRFTVALRAAC